MTADVSLSVPELKFYWSATFKDGERLKLPGFPLEIEGFPFRETDVYLEFSLKKENGNVTFKVLTFTEFDILFLPQSKYHKSRNNYFRPLQKSFLKSYLVY